MSTYTMVLTGHITAENLHEAEDKIRRILKDIDLNQYGVQIINQNNISECSHIRRKNYGDSPCPQ